MRRVDQVLPAALQDRMGGNEPTRIQNANLIRQLVNLDDALSSIGDAVVVTADRYQSVMADAAFQFEEFVKRHERKGLQLWLIVLAGEVPRSSSVLQAGSPSLGLRASAGRAKVPATRSWRMNKLQQGQNATTYFEWLTKAR